MVEFLARPLADAFMQVGVYVAVMVAIFGWLRYRYGDRATDALTRHQRWGPFLGALLGVSPGCGGAIVLMPLYARGKVSFGTVVAALTATMGDSSWVVIAADPAVAFWIHLLLFGVGLVTGYAVDLAGVAPEAMRGHAARRALGAARAVPVGPVAGIGTVPHASDVGGARTSTGGTHTAMNTTQPIKAVDVSPMAPVSPAPAARGTLTGRMSAAFWSLATPSFLVSVPVMFQAVDPAMLSTSLGGLDLYLVLGITGTLIALLIFGNGRGRLADDDLETAHPRSVRQTLRHSAHEASFITVWVAVAHLAWQVLSGLTGFDGSQLVLAGFVGVLAGALIGLVPGCAVQIVFTGLFTSGGLPLSTLVANAVSQDGDALIPLAALRRRAAVLATVITTIPAVLTGLTVLAFAG